MLRFTPPTKPTRFDADMLPHRNAIEAIVKNGKDPASADFKDAWADYKTVLAEHQHGKCGFCEAFVNTVSAGDVEHYAPKSEVGELNDSAPSSWGEEEPHSNRVLRKREVHRACTRGYWWRAYAWDNYLFACGNCNQKWKRTLFPLAEGPRTSPPAPGAPETPLLLHPFGTIDPVEHLRYNDFGAIEAAPNSAHGAATIRTCYLDRGSLTRARAADASAAFELTRRLRVARSQLNSAHGDTARVVLMETLGDLLRLGDERHQFAGMVRSIARQRTGCSWEQLVALAARLRSP